MSACLSVFLNDMHTPPKLKGSETQHEDGSSKGHVWNKSWAREAGACKERAPRAKVSSISLSLTGASLSPCLLTALLARSLQASNGKVGEGGGDFLFLSFFFHLTYLAHCCALGLSRQLFPLFNLSSFKLFLL